MKTKFKKKEFTEAIREKMFFKAYILKRQKKNFGLRVIAKEIGISFTTLSRIQNGSLPDVDTFFKLCHWMGCDINKFKTK